MDVPYFAKKQNTEIQSRRKQYFGEWRNMKSQHCHPGEPRSGPEVLHRGPGQLAGASFRDDK
jgi:hypothetical protein